MRKATLKCFDVKFAMDSQALRLAPHATSGCSLGTRHVPDRTSAGREGVNWERNTFQGGTNVASILSGTFLRNSRSDSCVEFASPSFFIQPRNFTH
jgi:hypothetical protein